MIKTSPLHIFGYASGLGAGNTGCSLGPIIMQASAYMRELPIKYVWENIFYPRESKSGLEAIPSIAEICRQLARAIAECVENKVPFLTIGGDHSGAIGTWSGAASAGALGLIWIDAHLDSHTHETTESKNVHGIPLAALLGYGVPRLTQMLSPQPKLSPNHVCIIGVRSFEPAEHEFLKKHRVKIYYMEDVIKLGFETVFKEALSIVTKGTAAFGVSVDLDAIDPSQAPGVGTPVKDGINSADLVLGLNKIAQHPKFVGAEIMEFNPNLDVDHKTEKIVADLTKSMFESR